MSRVLFLVALDLCLIACGDVSYVADLRQYYGAEPELVPYVAEFRDEMRLRGLGLGQAPKQLMWRSLDGASAIGVCILPYNFVYIDPDFRGPEHASLRRALVYHELAHCMYSTPHDEEEGHILSPELDGEEIAQWGEARWTYELNRLSDWIVAAGAGHGGEQTHLRWDAPRLPPLRDALDVVFDDSGDDPVDPREE